GRGLRPRAAASPSEERVAMQAMEYSKAALAVVDAVKAVREPDARIWWDTAVYAIADLYPTSALAFALYHPTVWPPHRRQDERSKSTRTHRIGFTIDAVVTAAEAAAAADGMQVVHEVHIARALSEFAIALQSLGIAVDVLIARTAERENPQRWAGPKRPRVVGTARGQMLGNALTDQHLEDILDQDERAGTVERKR